MGMDWLYHASSGSCENVNHKWDIPPWTLFPRLFLPLLHTVFGIVAACLCHRARLSREERFDSDCSKAAESEINGSIGPVRQLRNSVDLQVMATRKRLWHLDYARVICIACTVAEHSGGEAYSRKNIAWVQQWVLPYLYIISGMSWMLSGGTLVGYQLRLSAIFLVGLIANFLADWVRAEPFSLDTVYQMAYVPVLMLMSLCTFPLRAALRWRRNNPGASAASWIKAWTIFFAFLMVVPYVFFWVAWPYSSPKCSGPQRCEVLKANSVRSEAFLASLPPAGTQLFACIVCCLAACWAGCSGWLGWILLTECYVFRILIPYNRGPHAVNADLFVFGLVIQKWSLQKHLATTQVIQEYWPLLVLLLLFLTLPDAMGRCDLHPMSTTWERLRFYVIEFMLIAAFGSGSMNTSDSLGVTGWLGAWALYAYCFHVAWDRLLPRPYGAVLTYISAIVIFALRNWSIGRKSGRSDRNDVQMKNMNPDVEQDAPSPSSSGGHFTVGKAVCDAEGGGHSQNEQATTSLPMESARTRPSTCQSTAM
mmetsp:Transcript_42692/g.117812  ORF Transcript_42692/g.117812 Transcript_42692/m.117812 type:complete len:536 (-) Transcript_42692:82-1689(-)